MMKLKFKLLMFVMVLTLLITCVPSNGFAEGDSLDKKVQEIKTLFDIGEDYRDFDTYEYDSYDGKTITSLSWRMQDKSINVDIDEEGNIIGYSKNEYIPNRGSRINKFPKITREQGEKTAKDFIKKLYPDILDKIKSADEDELYSGYRRDNLTGRSYSFVRVENDMVFNENTVYINVDNQTGEVTNFNINWDNDLEFPDIEGIISKDEAKEIYKDNIDLELIYRVEETDEGEKSYLGYNVVDTDKTVDAKTKDILSTSYKSTLYIYGTLSNQNMVSISTDEENELIDSNKIISRKEASEKIMNTFELGEGYEVQDHKLKGNKEKDAYIWEVMVMKQVGNHGSGVGSIIDAKTGEIISFSDPGSWGEEPEEPKYSKEELLEKAKETLKKNSPEKYEEVEYIEDENEDSIYSRNNISNFLFIRKLNDIRVENNGFRIILNNATGNVDSYDYNWSNLEFESPDNIVQKDEAKEILLEDRELDLGYQTLEEEEKKNVKLVYDFKDKHLVVDAKKAEVIDSIKESMERTGIKEYKDIEDSFAKDQIQKLQNYIFLFKGEEFKPEQEITQKEFFQLLVQTTDMYYLYEDQSYLYERFVDEGIVKIEEQNMEGKVTREEAIKYIVRAFGQEPLDTIGDIYKVDYDDADDISTNLKGHIAIAKGLGIISGEGEFRPKDNLTREEAAVMIYNILNRDI